MKKIRFILGIFFLLVGIVCFPVPGQTPEPPAWVILEKGKLAFYNKEYGVALDLFKTALTVKNNYPEAEVLIGDIYTIEGEYVIAKKQYQKAYNERDFFEIPDARYPAMYKLAELYKREEEYKNYEDTLLRIIDENQEYYKQTFVIFREKFPDLFKKEGLDRLMILYRLTDTFASRAHAELGWFYYKSGRFDTALMHSLFAVNILLSETINALKRDNAEYKFTSVRELLEDVLDKIDSIPEKNIEAATAGESSLEKWLLDEEIFRKFYYLACAAYGAGSREQAKKVWTLVAGSGYSREWGTLAARQLVNPWIEDYIDLDYK